MTLLFSHDFENSVYSLRLLEWLYGGKKAEQKRKKKEAEVKSSAPFWKYSMLCSVYSLPTDILRLPW
jgi:hypothetical protein